jgi:hypothetical protein
MQLKLQLPAIRMIKLKREKIENSILFFVSPFLSVVPDASHFILNSLLFFLPSFIFFFLAITHNHRDREFMRQKRISCELFKNNKKPCNNKKKILRRALKKHIKK